MKEAILTIALYALAALLASTSIAGLVLVTAWLGYGLYMVANSRSRGLWADVSFLVTWPLYWVLGR
ncbi:hypothetical protein [Synechococcus phage Yong-M3-232]|nr:hypothetical protein [Synechococcus phage Yong-M3-232]